MNKIAKQIISGNPENIMSLVKLVITNNTMPNKDVVLNVNCYKFIPGDVSLSRFKICEN